MRHFLMAMAILGTVAAGMPSGASAQGLVADLVPTANAIACTADLVPPNCESNASGGAGAVKFRGDNFLNVVVSDLLGGQIYVTSNNGVSLDSCEGIVSTFTTLADGSASFTAALPGTPADFVVICRETGTGLVPIMNGALGKVGRPGAP